MGHASRILFVAGKNHGSKIFTERLQGTASKFNLHADIITSTQEYHELSNASSYDSMLLYTTGQIGGHILSNQVKNNTALRWVHSFQAGVDQYLGDQSVRNADHVALTNVKSAYSENLAQYAMFGALFFAKKTHHFQQAFRSKQWSPAIVEDASLQTALIVGYGDIGAACAKKFHNGLSMRVLGMKANPASVSDEHRAYVESVIGPEELGKVIGQADYVLNALPLTEATRGFFNASVFQAMKPSAIYINIGRGQTDNDADLLSALKNKVISGAVLDVFNQEPLPPEHEFWDLPNVLMTPHACDDTIDNHDRAFDIYEQILAKYLAKEELFNVVNKQKGY